MKKIFILLLFILFLFNGLVFVNESDDIEARYNEFLNKDTLTYNQLKSMEDSIIVNEYDSIKAKEREKSADKDKISDEFKKKIIDLSKKDYDELKNMNFSDEKINILKSLEGKSYLEVSDKVARSVSSNMSFRLEKNSFNRDNGVAKCYWA